MNYFHLLESLSWELGSIIAIFTFVSFAILGIFIVRKTFSAKQLKAHHDVAGFVFANLGVLYSVLIGFTVVNVQQRFDKVKETTHMEASILTQLYRDSEVFSEAKGDNIRNAIKNYVLTVINNEWPSMAAGKPSEITEGALDKVWRAYYDLDFKDAKQQVWYSESIGKLNQLTGARIDRLMGSVESLGGEMWASLILGGLLIISFIWFFGLESLTTHILMATVLASVTAFLLFLIYSLDSSFSGDVNIGPDAFEKVLQTLN